MSLDYLKFVEAHETYKDFNVFEKVLIATKRAKDIYEGEGETGAEDESDRRKTKRRAIPHKPTYRAILEVNEGKIKTHYPTPEELAAAEKEVGEVENATEGSNLTE